MQQTIKWNNLLAPLIMVIQTLSSRTTHVIQKNAKTVQVTIRLDEHIFFTITHVCFTFPLHCLNPGSVSGESSEVLYSKSEQTSFTPPLLGSFTDRDLSVPRMWVCVHKGTHKLHLSHTSTHTHTHTHTRWFLCVSGLHCVHCMEKRGREGPAERLAVPARWELAVGCRETFSGCAALHHCSPQTLFFRVDSEVGSMQEILTQFSSSSVAFLPNSEKISLWKRSLTNRRIARRL